MVDFRRIKEEKMPSDTKTAVIVQQQATIDALLEQVSRLESSLDVTAKKVQEITTYLSTIVALNGGTMVVEVPPSFIADPENLPGGVSAIWDKASHTLTLEIF
jgi:hypothetical protein